MYFPGNDQDHGGAGRLQMRPGQADFAKTAKSEDFSFGDLVDTLNPLQHIPVVSSLYRELTGDQIAAAPRMMGSVLYGGATGMVSGLANAVAYQDSGKDLGEHAVAMVFGDGTEDAGPQATPVAAASAADSAAQDAAAPTHGSGPSDESLSTAGNSGAAASPASAAESNQATASAGPAVGNAALQALMRDLQAGGALQDGAAATPAGGSESRPEPRETQRQQQAAAPGTFMPIRQHDVVPGTGPRPSAAALRAEGDLMGSKRVQAAPKDARTSQREPAAADQRERTAETAAAQAPQATGKPADGADASAGGTAFSNGDFADRMMRALDKYQNLRDR